MGEKIGVYLWMCKCALHIEHSGKATLRLWHLNKDMENIMNLLHGCLGGCFRLSQHKKHGYSKSEEQQGVGWGMGQDHTRTLDGNRKLLWFERQCPARIHVGT